MALKENCWSHYLVLNVIRNIKINKQLNEEIKPKGTKNEYDS